MKTEINGDFIGYMKRFRLPSARAFQYPLKFACIAFLVQLLVVAVLWFVPVQPMIKIVPVFALMASSIFFFLKVHSRLFWNVVLEESLGLVPDLIMWVYYLVICAISISPSFVGLVYFLG